MRFVAWLLCMALGATALCEMLWRQQHAALQEDAWSRGPSRVAEVRRLPADAREAPLGVGVYVRPGWSPVDVGMAELAFAGYCSSIHTRWLADDHLQVNCELSPKGGEPWTAGAGLKGLRVKAVVVRPQQAA